MKHSFKKYIVENGFPFLNVIDDEMETLFGHKKDDFIKDKSPENIDPKIDKKEKTKRKLNTYLKYAKNIND